MKKQSEPRTQITFREVIPDMGAKGKIKKQYRKKGDEVFPIKIFLKHIPIGFITFKPKIQIQIRGKNLGVKCKTLMEAKKAVLNHLDA